MQKDYNENDTEKNIFRGKLDSLQIEPSEKFWNTALHSIIDKERVQSKRTIRKWRFTAYSLGAVVLFFCVHEVWMGGRMGAIEKQVAEIQGERNKLAQKDNTAQTAVANADNKVAQQTNTNNGSTQQPVAATKNNVLPENTINAKPVKQEGAPVKENSAAVRNAVKPNYVAFNKADESKQVISAKSIKSSTAWHTSDNNKMASGNANEEQQPADTKVTSAVNSSSGNTVKSTVPANVLNDGKPVTNNQNEPAMASVNQPESSQQNTNGAKQQAVNVLTGSISSSGDSVNVIPPSQNPVADKVAFKNRLSLSAFFTPGMVNDFMKCKDYDRDNDNDHVSAGDLKNRQSKWFGYQTGINIGVDLSQHFKLSTGVYYSRYSYDIKETLLKAELQENGDVGCTLVTSSGVVYIPYETTPLRVGDSLKVHGNSSRDYICIPLRFYWNIISHNKLGFYAAGGLDANLSAHSSTDLNWENTNLQEGQVKVQSTEGLSAVHYAYNFGLGLTYMLGHGISLYGEPHLQGSLTSINKNTPVVTYPYFFGCEVGLTWHL